MNSARFDRRTPSAHRLAIIYLTLPLVIWLVGWLEWWFGVPAALLLLALGWVMLTAAGNLFDLSNGDWFKHRAVLLDLSLESWPVYLPNYFAVYLPSETDPAPFLLRYYLGWYMVPGLAGHWFGPAALNWAVPIWTWCGVTLILLLFTRNFKASRGAIAAAIILICFSGMDVLRVILLEGWDSLAIKFTGNLERVDFGNVHYNI